MLLKFFGQSYRTYQQRVATGIPGVPGYMESLATVVWGAGLQEEEQEVEVVEQEREHQE